MKTATIIIRILLGALLLFGSIPYFLNLFPQPELTGNMKTFSDGLNAAVYLMPLVKAVELICGIAFITNRFIPLATIIIFPIAINILCVNIFLVTEGLPVAIFILVANLFLAYRNREQYKIILLAKS
jgi:putative oxidoreductase